MWQWQAVVAMACYASLQLLFKHFTNRGLSPAQVLFWVFLSCTGCFLLQAGAARQLVPVPGARMLALLVATGVVAYVGNLYAVRAIAAAANPGYPTAIVGLQAVVVTLAAAVLMGAAVSGTKLAGVLLCAAGVALLVA